MKNIRNKLILIISFILAATLIIIAMVINDNSKVTQPVTNTEPVTEAPTEFETALPTLADASENDKDISTKLTEYAGRMNFSGSVYLVDKGEVILDFAQGDYSGKGSDIKYGVASVTKQITAASVMQLFEDGKLDLDDKLSQYFPKYSIGKDITVRQLLCQRSGIPDYSIDYSDDAAWAYTDNSTYMVMVKKENTSQLNRNIIKDLVFDCELLFEPGEEFYYSDSNYALLADIVEQVSGESFHDYVRENIFEPLGMTAAFIDDYSYGYDVTVAGTDRSEFDDDYFKYKGLEFGCGDMLASTGDLYKWYKGLTNAKVVSKSTYAQMIENYSSPEELGYGYGLMISDEVDCKTLFHYGFIPSYYSSIFMIPEHDVFAAVLANHEKGYPQTAACNIVKNYAKASGYEIINIE